VWLATVGAALWIYMDIEAGPTIVGFAHSVEYAVSPVRNARVITVAVEVGQEVVEGQVLVLLDPAEIERDIAVLEAKYGRAQSELLAATERAKQDVAQRNASSENRRAQIEEQLLDARASRMTADAERRAKRVERKRIKKLVDERLADRGRLAALDARLATLDARVDASQTSVKVFEKRLKAAKPVVVTTPGAHVEIMTAPYRHDIEVIDTQLHALRAHRREAVLRAPANGRVAEVRLHPGSVAGPDEPVVKIIGEPGGRVIACVGEAQALDVRVGDPATVWPRKAGSESLGGKGTLALSTQYGATVVGPGRGYSFG
jgi:multidrug resistance efflux pump